MFVWMLPIGLERQILHCTAIYKTPFARIRTKNGEGEY